MANITFKRLLSAGVCLAIAAWSIVYAPGQLEPWLGTIFAIIASLWLAIESVGVSTWIMFPTLWRRPNQRSGSVAEKPSGGVPPQPLTTDN
jgi:hypothetical protein